MSSFSCTHVGPLSQGVVFEDVFNIIFANIRIMKAWTPDTCSFTFVPIKLTKIKLVSAYAEAGHSRSFPRHQTLLKMFHELKPKLDKEM